MTDTAFDYITASRSMNIPIEIVLDIEAQVKQEFPHDAMMMELHVLRALKAYARQRQQVVAHEN